MNIRLKREARRDQILAAATLVFAAGGFAPTNLDDVAAAAGISRAILYRHFDSKTDLYRAALDRAFARLEGSVEEAPGAFTMASIDGMVSAASADPDGFRLVFRQAIREPEFRPEMERLRTGMIEVAHLQISEVVGDKAWALWASHMAPTLVIEAVLAWLDVGQPDPELAAARIKHLVAGVTQAARG